MNNDYHENRDLKKVGMPEQIDTFINYENDSKTPYIIEYDGWRFEGRTMKSATNKVLKYIFCGGKN